MQKVSFTGEGNTVALKPSARMAQRLGPDPEILYEEETSESPVASRGAVVGSGWEDTEEAVETDLTSDQVEPANDPVRTYLREMGRVPLLKREQEVSIAQRIERGQMRVLRAISRSPLVVEELLVMRDELRSRARSIRDVVVLDNNEEAISEKTIAAKTRQVLRVLDRVRELHQVGGCIGDAGVLGLQAFERAARLAAAVEGGAGARAVRVGDVALRLVPGTAVRAVAARDG